MAQRQEPAIPEGLPIRFITFAIPTSNVDLVYSGGLAQFTNDYPNHKDADGLVGLTCMSGEDAELIADELAAKGLTPSQHYAVGDMHLGATHSCTRVFFECHGEGPSSQWFAQLETRR